MSSIESEKSSLKKGEVYVGRGRVGVEQGRMKPHFLLNTRKATYATQALPCTSTQETHATQALALTKYATQLTRVAKRKRTQDKQPIQFSFFRLAFSDSILDTRLSVILLY